MNQIEIFKPFGEAVELTKRILFQPFDLKKWFVIGFTAFLAHLGGGFNFQYENYNGTHNGSNDWRQNAGWQQISDWMSGIPHWVLLLGIVALVTFILILMVVFTWLRARGIFMFIDCIVKNRAAVAQPWREFHREGNSLFLFQLLVMFVFLFIALVLALPFALPLIRGGNLAHLHDVYLISMIAMWAGVIGLLALAWAVIGQLMVVIMYRRRCGAGDGFRAALSLVSNHPGEIVLYCLFWVVLALGTVVVACLATCVTCCLTALPYIGTVILLPLYVCLRGFVLLFVRQFGPDYDAWGGLPPAAPSLPPTPPPFVPQPA